MDKSNWGDPVDTPVLICEDPHRTQQHFKDECNINTIIKRWSQGQQPPPPTGIALYGDFTGITDFAAASEIVANGHQEFLKLRPEIRLRFNNKLADLLDWLEDPENLEESYRLGLRLRPPPGEPDPEPPEDPAPAPPEGDTPAVT